MSEPEFNMLDPDRDVFKPPKISTLVHCLHCNEEYDSYRIEWRLMTDNKGRPYGQWCCPISGCDGAGFLFDIFPVDPDYRDEEGNLVWDVDDDESDEFDEEWDDDDLPDLPDDLPGEGKPGRKSPADEDDIPF
jgi:hypothetical protein